MTRAKRYEGEALRAEQWYNMGRDKAWDKRREGMRRIEPMVAGKFVLHVDIKYDPVDCGYLILTELTVTGTQHVPGIFVRRPEDLIMRHEEPSLEFPSDHLMTKILLITGGTTNA